MALGHTFDTITKKCKQYLCNQPIPQGFYPSQIVAKLIEEAQRAKVETSNGILVPDRYTFAVTKEEYRKIEKIAESLQARILVCLDEAIENLNYHTQGSLTFRFVVCESKDDKIVASEPCNLAADEPCESELVSNEEDCDLTRVFDKALPPRPESVQKKAVLCVAKGADQGKRFVFGDNRVNIGRRENNDMVLTDSGVSRLHAYIITENGNHMLYDARSLNGTYLNEVRIVKQVLHAGDLIKVGSTLIEYEVIK